MIEATFIKLGEATLLRVDQISMIYSIDPIVSGNTTRIVMANGRSVDVAETTDQIADIILNAELGF